MIKKLYKTNEKLVSDNYPYGFRLKTTKTDWLEFNAKRGFRFCSMTINPKTGKENKPKKSTYHEVMILGRDENDHVKTKSFEFYNPESVNELINFLKVQKNFELFTPEQIKYIYFRLISFIKIDMKAKVIYGGAKAENLMPLYKESLEIAVQGVKDEGKVNHFDKISFDWDKIEAERDSNYQPFKIKSYGV